MRTFGAEFMIAGLISMGVIKVIDADMTLVVALIAVVAGSLLFVFGKK